MKKILILLALSITPLLFFNNCSDIDAPVAIGGDEALGSNVPDNTPLYSIESTGGMYPANAVRVNRTILTVDGRVIQQKSDGSETVIGAISGPLARRLVRRLNYVNDVNLYSLVNQEGATMCDVAYAHYLYLGRVPLKVVEQKNCGPLSDLALTGREPMQPNVGDLPEEQRPLDIVAAYKLVRSLIEAVMTASRI